MSAILYLKTIYIFHASNFLGDIHAEKSWNIFGVVAIFKSKMADLTWLFHYGLASKNYWYG